MIFDKKTHVKKRKLDKMNYLIVTRKINEKKILKIKKQEKYK